MKRFGIYIIYDSDNIVDTYIGFMLQELRKVVQCMVVVCNNKYIDKGIENIEPYADKIFYRENIGYDAGGFKDTLCTFIGWDELGQFDELILANDSVFGPFRSMKEIFGEMAKETCDFWGMTKHKETLLIPEHLQSFFLVFRKKILHSKVFQDFWESLPYYYSFNEVVEQYEMKLTNFFYKKGYKFACYSDMEPNDTDNIENNFVQYGFISNELVRRRHFPFLKRKSINYTTLNQQTQENIPQVLAYVKNHTEYDVNMIYENCIRLMNISDLHRKLCLNYILSDESSNDEMNFAGIAIVVLTEYANSCEYVTDYLNKITEICNIFILSSSKVVLNCYIEYGFNCFTYSRDNQKLLFDILSKYDLICLIHDVDVSSDKTPSYVGKAAFYNIWENLLSSSGYIMNVVDVFVRNEKLGLLMIPTANFGTYFGDTGIGWNGRFEDVSQVIERYHIQCRLDYTKPPFELSYNYWIRGELFHYIKTGESDLFDLLPWLWGYIAQGMGYYSGIVQNIKYAEMNEINQQYYLDAICAQIRDQFGEFSTFEDMQELLSRKAVLEYCQKYEGVYIYGTGKIADKFSSFIPNILAYIVSDRQKKLKTFCAKDVFYLSDIEKIKNNTEIGLIICLDKRHQAEVIPQIRKKGFKNYLCV